MNEDQLADILTQHLDALLEGSSLPEGLPAEVAELLGVAQNLTEVAPTPQPEFGLALKESLLGPTSGGNGPVDPTGSTGATGPAFGSHMVLIIVVSLVGLAVVLTLLIGAVIFGVTQSTLFGSPSPPTRPVQTEVIPTQSNPSPTPAAPTLTPTAPDQLDSTSSPAPTATTILDILPPITVTIEVSPPPGLVPGPGGDGGGNDGSGSGSSGGGGNGGGGDNDDGGGGDD